MSAFVDSPAVSTPTESAPAATPTDNASIGLFAPEAKSPESSVAPSPAAAPQPTHNVNPWANFTPQQFTQMQAQAFKQAHQLAPVQKPDPWSDRAKFWTIPDGHPDPAGEFHGRLEQFVSAQNAPIFQELEALRGAVQYLNANKSADPEFAVIENDVNELLQSGAVRDIRLARELASLRRAKAGIAPVAPVQSGFGIPKPTPPQYTSTPNSRTAPSVPPKFDPRQRPDIMRITQGLLEKEGML